LPTAAGIAAGKTAKYYGVGASYGVNVFFTSDQTNVGFGRYKLAAQNTVAGSTNYSGMSAIPAGSFYYGFSGNS